MSEREQIVSRLSDLQAKQEAATGWGAAVGAREEEIRSLESRLLRIDSMTAPPSTETPRHTATALDRLISSHASLTARVAELEKFGNYVQHLRDCRMFDKYKRVCDCGLSDLRSALSQTKEGRDFDFPIVSDHGSRTP